MGGVCFLAAWQLAAMAVNTPYILPRPAAVLRSLAGLFGLSEFGAVCLGTLGRWALGVAPAIVLGLVFGGLSAVSPRFGAFLSPLFTVIKSVPIVAVILLALVWFEAPFVPSFAVFLATFPTVCDNAAAGVRSVDVRLVEMTRVYRFGRARRVRLLYLPSLQPYFFAALRTAFGVGLKAVVVAELVVQPKLSIGAYMQTARATLQTAEILSWTLLIVLSGYLLELLVDLIEKRLTRWKGGGVK